jgi:hypothetical protein
VQLAYLADGGEGGPVGPWRFPAGAMDDVSMALPSSLTTEARVRTGFHGNH